MQRWISHTAAAVKWKKAKTDDTFWRAQHCATSKTDARARRRPQSWAGEKPISNLWTFPAISNRSFILPFGEDACCIPHRGDRCGRGISFRALMSQLSRGEGYIRSDPPDEEEVLTNKCIIGMEELNRLQSPDQAMLGGILLESPATWALPYATLSPSDVARGATKSLEKAMKSLATRREFHLPTLKDIATWSLLLATLSPSNLAREATKSLTTRSQYHFSAHSWSKVVETVSKNC